MSEISRIGLDTSKSVFTLHGVKPSGEPVLRVNLRRAQVIPFFRKQPSIVVAMEACGGSHHWARRLSALGHEVRLIPPQYVKPYLKRGKNDRNDAEAICEAAARPGMRFVVAKTEDQQAQGMVLKVRATLVEQRTQLINALRGHPIGDRAMTEAERQARYRAARAAGAPVIRIRRPIDRRGRAQRWNDSVAALIELQADYAAWLDAVPDAIRDSATGEALQAIVELNLGELIAIQPPRGFGRDKAAA